MDNVRDLKSKMMIEQMKEEEFLRLVEMIGIERAREIISELWEKYRSGKVVHLDLFR